MHAFVNITVAVVVQPIAQLWRAKEYGGVGIIAVGIVGHEPGGGSTSKRCRIRIAKPVAIRIGEEGGLHAFIDVVIAIVVQPVAQLWRAGENSGVGIVTVGVVGHEPGGGSTSKRCRIRITKTVAIRIGEKGGLYALINITVAVVVQAVA